MNHRFIVAAVFLGAFVLCDHPNPGSIDQSVPTPTKIRAYAKIDMLTSATGRHFKVDSAIIYSRSAQVYWWDDFDDGDEHFLKWGADSLTWNDSVNLRPFVRRTHVMTEIDSLVPGNRYFALFHRPYKRDVKDNLRFSFVTPVEDSVEISPAQ